MQLLILIGSIVVIALIIIGAVYLADNVTFKKGKRK